MHSDDFLIEPNEEYCYEYVYYLLRYYGKYLADLQTGSAIPHVTPKTIYSLKAPIPDYRTQERIAEILLGYDKLIVNNQKRIDILERMAENIYREWFVRFRFPGHENVEYENGIPQGWSLKSLFEIANVTYGYTFKSEDFCDDVTLNPVVRIRDVPNNKTNTFTSEQCDEKYLIKENSTRTSLTVIMPVAQRMRITTSNFLN